MDLSVAVAKMSISTDSTNDESNGKEDEKVVSLSNRAKFYSTYRRQRFSLPFSIMQYIAMNPTNAALYQKLIESCKYFFLKNPLLVISDLDYDGNDKWRINFDMESVDLTNFMSKFWIDNSCNSRFCISGNPVNQNIASSIIPKIYRNDAQLLYIEHQTISYRDLPLLVSSAESINFSNITVKNNDGSILGLEKIVEAAVKAKKYEIHYDAPSRCITSKTMKELVKIPHFSKLDKFYLYFITEVFDLDAFYDHMKKNQHTKFSLEFDVSISQAYKARLESIVDEIIATEELDYKPPLIYFDGIDEENNQKLQRIYFSL